MKSTVVKRSIMLAGHKTSVSLEDAFWRGLKDIATNRRMTMSDLVSSIDLTASTAICRRPCGCLCSITFRREQRKSVELANVWDKRESPGLERPGLNGQKEGDSRGWALTTSDGSDDERPPAAWPCLPFPKWGSGTSSPKVTRKTNTARPADRMRYPSKHDNSRC